MNCAAEGIDLRAEPSRRIHRFYRAMTQMDIPSEPEESGRPEQASARAERLSPKSRELPDPDERGRVYEAMRAHAEVEAVERPEQVPGSGTRNQGATGARFRGSGGCGQTTKNAGRRTGSQWRGADSPIDPPGSYRGNGGFPLSPERHKETIDAISRPRKAESAISADAQTVEKENTSSGWLEGFDRRLKGDDRLKEKVAEDWEHNHRKTASRPCGRFLTRSATRSASARKLCRGYYDIKARLESFGNEMYLSKNSWGATSTKVLIPDG